MTFDKALIEQRFSSHLDKYNSLASVQKEICAKMYAKIKELIEPANIKSALELGAGTGFLSSHLLNLFDKTNWLLNDITPKSQEYIKQLTINKCVNYLWGDAEQIDFPLNLDLIATSSTVQWFDNLDAFIQKCSASSSPNSYLAISTFGKDNFKQIKEITGEGIEYYHCHELESMLNKSGYEVLYKEEYTKTLSFKSPIDVLHHIKSTGVNGITRERWTRKKLFDFSSKYNNLCGGKIELTYQPIIMIARKRQ